MNVTKESLPLQHRKRPHKRLRERRFKLHVLFLVGMMEAEFVSVQTQAAQGVVVGIGALGLFVCRSAIFRVAYYGMPNVGHVDTNLVLAASFQLQL